MLTWYLAVYSRCPRGKVTVILVQASCRLFVDCISTYLSIHLLDTSHFFSFYCSATPLYKSHWLTQVHPYLHNVIIHHFNIYLIHLQSSIIALRTKPPPLGRSCRFHSAWRGLEEINRIHYNIHLNWQLLRANYNMHWKRLMLMREPAVSKGWAIHLVALKVPPASTHHSRKTSCHCESPPHYSHTTRGWPLPDSA